MFVVQRPHDENVTVAHTSDDSEPEHKPTEPLFKTKAMLKIPPLEFQKVETKTELKSEPKCIISESSHNIAHVAHRTELSPIGTSKSPTKSPSSISSTIQNLASRLSQPPSVTSAAVGQAAASSSSTASIATTDLFSPPAKITLKFNRAAVNQ